MRVLFPSNRSVWRLVRGALLFLWAVAGCRSAGSGPAPPQEAPALSAVAAWHFAIADFDGDSQPDLATIQAGEAGGSETRYWIRFQLSSGSRRVVGVRAPTGGLEIAPLDVNGDKILDLVVTTAWLNQPVAVLLNDGHGNFTLSSSAAFPVAIWGTETSGAIASVPPGDAAVVALRRSLCGAFERSQRVASAPRLPGVLVSLNSHVPSFSLCASVLGRAPPAWLHHV